MYKIYHCLKSFCAVFLLYITYFTYVKIPEDNVIIFAFSVKHILNISNRGIIFTLMLTISVALTLFLIFQVSFCYNFPFV